MNQNTMIQKITTTDIIPSDTNDWDLIVAINHYSRTPIIGMDLHQKIMAKTWSMIDAYGQTEDGQNYIPADWDWSGIRDSSEAAHKRMATMIRKELKAVNSGVYFRMVERTWVMGEAA